MNKEEFALHWSAFQTEKWELVDRRTILETELSEISTKITHLDSLLEHLAPLSGITTNEDISGLGITDAIRAVLKGSKERMSATEVRSTLVERGFDLSDHSAPMASIYKILGRLTEDGDSSVEREKEDGRVFYRWKDPTGSAEITDDDIPF
jgi:hypothetical protein